MGRRVCILAAGKGVRLGGLCAYTNKSLVPVGYRPVLSRIIEKFPPDTEFVVALGHQAHLVRDYIALVYPELNVQFVEVDNYTQPGSGPGYSLLCCRPYLEEPFLLTTCDTLVDEEVHDCTENWIGVAAHGRIEEYCSVGLNKEGFVTRIDYREKVEGNLAFIGIAGIYDVDVFWRALGGDRGLIFGEYQISNGLKGLLQHGLKAQTFTWFDTGTLEGLQTANRYYGTGFSNFDKENEFIYFVNGGVVKFFADMGIVQKRVARNRLLGKLCPVITNSKPNFYRYDYIEGKKLAEVGDDATFAHFLEWCREKLWIPAELGADAQTEFKRLCYLFYKDKTESRLKMFHDTARIPDREEEINGYRVPSTRELLEQIDWDWMSSGIAVQFHGDLHFDNAIVPSDSLNGEFKLLDWRQDFSGKLEYGDWYYDLAKIYHALLISHEQIKKNRYSVEIHGDHVRYSYLTSSELISCQKVMRTFLKRVGLDCRKVLVLTHLIYLNMSPLHHHPFNLLLYFHGKLGLYKLLEQSVIR